MRCCDGGSDLSLSYPMMDRRGVRALLRGAYVTKMAERTANLEKREAAERQNGSESYFGISSKDSI